MGRRESVVSRVFRKNSEAFVPTSESGLVDFSGRDPLVEFAKENIRYRRKLACTFVRINVFPMED